MVFSATNTGPVQAQPIQQVTPIVVKGDNSEVGAYVSNYFSDIPIMVKVAWCESRDRMWTKDGSSVFRGTVDNQDVGVMQINEHYQLDTAQEGNYNIYSLPGNVAYARDLYERFGTAPWNSSKPCWGNPNTKIGDDQVAVNQN